jgi:hypothetical protein
MNDATTIDDATFAILDKTYRVKIRVGPCEEFAETLGFDLMNAPLQGRMHELLVDHKTLMAILWELCGDQQDLTLDDWKRHADADVLFAMWQALVAAQVGFTRRLRGDRAAEGLRQAIERAAEMMDAAAEAAREEALASMPATTEKLVAAVRTQAKETLAAELDAAFGPAPLEKAPRRHEAADAAPAKSPSTSGMSSIGPSASLEAPSITGR